MTLTIAYFTSRRFLEGTFAWFTDSLRREVGHDWSDINVVAVDFWQSEHVGAFPSWVRHVAPKPTVWQGPHRLTTQDYFAASNARNTAICYSPDGWIAYVDDLSVLLPGWLKCVRQAMKENYIVLGAYRKVLCLEVEDGIVQSFTDYPQGHDSRWRYGRDDGPVQHGAGALFGCSLAGPVEAFLATNGWDESCDGMGYEDSCQGIMLAEKQAFKLFYDRRMMTYESEELHHKEQAFMRVDKKLPNATTVMPDASHAMLARVRSGKGVAENAHFPPGGIRAMRQRVLAGEAFPIPTEPKTHWPDQQPLSEM